MEHIHDVQEKIKMTGQQACYQQFPSEDNKEKEKLCSIP